MTTSTAIVVRLLLTTKVDSCTTNEQSALSTAQAWTSEGFATAGRGSVFDYCLPRSRGYRSVEPSVQALVLCVQQWEVLGRLALEGLFLVSIGLSSAAPWSSDFVSRSVPHLPKHFLDVNPREPKWKRSFWCSNRKAKRSNLSSVSSFYLICPRKRYFIKDMFRGKWQAIDPISIYYIDELRIPAPISDKGATNWSRAGAHVVRDVAICVP